MSTAVMHQAAMYDFGEVLLKNQAVAARNTINQINNNGPVATHQLLQQALSATTISNNTNNNFNNNSTLQQQQMNNPKLIRWEQTKMSMTAAPPTPTITPSQLHQVLFRTNSSPVISMTSLMNSLMETYEHRKLERSRSDPMPHMKVSAQAQAALAAQINTSRYKTELCRPFEEAGTCKYGDKCQFAHGVLELRNLQRHPKYKTELCRTFHSVGFCPYGPRCHFIHNAEEAKEHNRSVKAYLDAQQAQKARLAQESQHRPAPLSLSPTFSMSTTSDHTTPPDSNSPSPTSPLASFFGMEQDHQQHLHQPLEIQSPTLHGINFPSSPSYSTGNAASFTYNAEYAHSTSSNATNTPPTSPPIVNGAESAVSGNGIVEESRLPVFNRLSSVFGVDNLKKI